MMETSQQRTINSRYIDPLELIWLVTARRLGLTVRRNDRVYAATDGTGLLELGTRDTLDEDDNTAQMIFHEVCHWITNGLETFHERDWGFPLVDTSDWREHSGLRLQAWLAHRHGVTGFFASTSSFSRVYYDKIEDSPLEPLDDSPREAQVVALAREAVERSQGEPWQPHLDQALQATARIKDVLEPFLPGYVTDLPDDPLPSLWATMPPSS